MSVDTGHFEIEADAWLLHPQLKWSDTRASSFGVSDRIVTPGPRVRGPGSAVTLRRSPMCGALSRLLKRSIQGPVFMRSPQATTRGHQLKTNEFTIHNNSHAYHMLDEAGSVGGTGTLGTPVASESRRRSDPESDPTKL